jgi:hypothetical protein
LSISAITLPTYRLYNWGTFPYNVTNGALTYDPYTVPSYTIRSPNSFYDFTLQSPTDDAGNTTALDTYYSLNTLGRSVAVSQPSSQAYASTYPYSFRVNAQKLKNPYSTQPLLTAYTPTDITYNPITTRYQTQSQFFETSATNLQGYLDANNSFYLPYLRLQVTQKGNGYTVIQQADGTFTLTETPTDGLDTIGVVNTPQSVLSRFLDSATSVAPDIFALIESASFPLNVPTVGITSLETETPTGASTAVTTTTPPPEVPPPPIATTEVGNASLPLIAILPAQKNGDVGNNTAISSIPPFLALQNPIETTTKQPSVDFFKTEPSFLSASYNQASVGNSLNTPFPAMEAFRLQDFRRPFAFPPPPMDALPLAQETAFAGQAMDFTQTPAGFGNMANLGEHQELNRQRATGEPLIARQFRIKRLRQAMKSLK